MKTKTEKHTPGPWKRSAESSGCYIESSDGRKVAGVFTDTKHNEVRTTFAQAEANASLIAAAPDLLEVARLVEACRYNGWEWGRDIERLQDAARSAIAKAEK